jgi:RsiW-degrading membrane proteinase PrsW (M82 family)
VTYLGVGTLVPITGNMNSEKYINTLDEFLWPVVTSVGFRYCEGLSYFMSENHKNVNVAELSW